MATHCSNSRPRAYTLIELLIVLALLGIAASLVVPKLVGRDDLTVQAAVRRIISDLNFAQSDALAHQQMRRVVFFDDGSGYALVRVVSGNFDDAFDPDSADYISDPLASSAQQSRYIVEFAEDSRFEGVSITDVDIDGGYSYVTYDELGGTIMTGMVPGLGGRIELTFGDFKYEVTIEPFTGKLTVQQIP